MEFRSDRLTSMSFFRSAVLVVCATGSITSVLAFRPTNVGPGELALLPPYCVDTEGFMYGPENSPTQSPRAREWVGTMGRSFWSLHHYCWGLVNLNRLRTGKADAKDKQQFASSIVNEYQYVIRNSSPDFILLPEIWTRIGEASLLAGDIGGALEAYATARQIKPDYWPAYTQWAEFLLRYDKKAEAKELVKKGLEQVPDAAPLIALYRRLGGDPATVVRTRTAVPAPAPSASGASGAAD